MDVKENVKDPKQRILKFIQLNRVQMVIAACGLVLFLHFVLAVLQYDASISGRAKKWIARHNIRSMKTKGGVVIFLHRPRTGGRSIKSNLNKVDYGIVMAHPHANQSYMQNSLIVNNILQGKVDEDADPPRISFLSLHEDFAMLPKVQEDIERWRALAKRHSTALFVFSLVRNPVDYHVSHFNEFRVSPCTSPFCVKPLLEPNDVNLLSDMKANEQCRGFTKPPGDQSAVTDEECVKVFEWMKKNMDWIGTTENLSTETLPLLAELLFGDADRSETMRVVNAMTKVNILVPSSLQYQTGREIRRKSALDQKLYESVKYNYYL